MSPEAEKWLSRANFARMAESQMLAGADLGEKFGKTRQANEMRWLAEWHRRAADEAMMWASLAEKVAEQERLERLQLRLAPGVVKS